MAVTLNYFIVVHVLGFLLRYISSYQEFLYDCTFSRDLCGWTQDTNSDDFDWIRQHGSTPSADTGPNSDHTSIIVIEGIVGPSYKSDIAIDDTQMTSRPCSGEQSTDTTTTSTKITHAQLMSTDNGFHGGVKVTCTKYSWDIMIDMNKLRQEYPNAKSSDIYLGDNRCTGVEKQNLLEFSYGFTECLTTNMLHNGAHVYNNELIYAEHDPVYLYIIRHYNWTLGVQCEIQTDGTVKGSVQKPVINQSSVLNTTQYPVNISYYSDPNFMHQVSGHPLLEPAGSQVYVKVFTTLSDWNIKMRLNTCYTSPTQHVLDHLKYYLIKDGCEVDSNTHIMSQSTHETKFVFENFEYANNPQGGIYVFCDMTFCASSDWSNNCRQTCNPIVNNNP
ncbi:hypothetical protein ACF0H5_009756 [Mactra antiquata]